MVALEKVTCGRKNFDFFNDVLQCHNAIRMKIALNSDEFKAWHEVGHATVCLHLGGDLDSIEFL